MSSLGLEKTDLLRPRLPHQVPAIEWGMDRDCCGYYLDKRLGKCAVAISHVLNKPDVQRVLIISPVTAFLGWISDLTEDNQSHVLLHASSIEARYKLLQEADAANTKFYIINAQGLFTPAHRSFKCERCKSYPPEKKSTCGACGGTGQVTTGRPIPNEIALMPWDMIIWDEILAIANPESQTTIIAQKHLNSRHKVVLSGEYRPRSVEQVFEPLRWCFGSFMGHNRFWSWRRQFFQYDGAYSWVPKLGSLQTIKAAIMECCYVLSRKDAGLDGKVVRDTYYCELPTPIRKLYDHAEKYYEVPLPALEGAAPEAVEQFRETKYAPVVSLWKAQIVGGYPPAFPHLHSKHKMALLFDLLKGEFRNEYVVVLFRFNAELAIANELAKKKNIKCHDIHGGYSVGARLEIARQFQRGMYRVLFCQIKAVKYGLDLSRSDTMIRYSLPYDYDDISQSRDRLVHPLKQQTPLLYVDLMCRDTIDEDIMETSWERGLGSANFMTRAENRFKQRMQAKLQEEKTNAQHT